jgi:hypothetical protein
MVKRKPRIEEREWGIFEDKFEKQTRELTGRRYSWWRKRRLGRLHGDRAHTSPLVSPINTHTPIYRV